jgi:hypothetical protein
MSSHGSQHTHVHQPVGHPIHNDSHSPKPHASLPSDLAEEKFANDVDKKLAAEKSTLFKHLEELEALKQKQTKHGGACSADDEKELLKIQEKLVQFENSHKHGIVFGANLAKGDKVPAGQAVISDLLEKAHEFVREIQEKEEEYNKTHHGKSTPKPQVEGSHKGEHKVEHSCKAELKAEKKAEECVKHEDAKKEEAQLK